MTDTFVNNVLISFEWNKNPGYRQCLNIYLQSKKEIDKEYDKLNVSVSFVKDIIDNFLILGNKYFWGRHEFIVGPGSNEQDIFRQVE